MKKILSILLSLALCFSTLTFTTSAEEPTVGLFSANLGTEVLPDYKLVFRTEFWATGYLSIPASSNIKNVKVHYSYDGLDWNDEDAHIKKFAADGTMVYYFKTPRSSHIEDYRGPYNRFCLFAISYELNGQVYWNNNKGRNFVLRDSNIVPSTPYLLDKSILTSGPVTLETNYDGSKALSGTIVLKNLGYEKEVFIRYSTDGWMTNKDLPAHFTSTYDNGLEVWSYYDLLNEIPPHFRYALYYKVNGQTYWDNHFGDNYVITKE